MISSGTAKADMSQREAAQPQLAATGSQRPTRVRYSILVLGFSVGLVMYLDRTCMGFVITKTMSEFGVDKITMGWSVSAFNWMYSLFQVPGGWLAGRFG